MSVPAFGRLVASLPDFRNTGGILVRLLAPQGYCSHDYEEVVGSRQLRARAVISHEQYLIAET